VDHKLKVADASWGCRDVVSEMDGKMLIRLVEVLGEVHFPNRAVLEKPTTMRPHKINLAKEALDFAFQQKLDMKIKPNAEDLIDGDERNILAIVWAVMLRFVKFGDEEEGASLNAKDSLMLWVKNKIDSYGLDNTSFKSKCWKDGTALCALIHKHRPNLLDWNAVKQCTNPIENINRAFDAAHSYFDLDRYLEPSDLPKLDEASMVVYVSEYYYGIAEQRKVDLASRRINKLIAFTERNDSLREQYVQKAKHFVQNLNASRVVLGDRNVTNTLEGAKRKIAEFYDYKATTKNEMISEQLSLESFYNNLATRLSQKKRPPFKPEAGTSLQDVHAAMVQLEKDEKERSIALHAELNRQIKLGHWEEQHKSRFQKLEHWIKEKEAYLNKKEVSNSISEATFQLNILNAFDKEIPALKRDSVEPFVKLGANLAKEHFERTAEVQQRENVVNEGFKHLEKLSSEKRPVLLADLAREQEKERLRLEWAHLSHEYVDWLSSAIAVTAFTHFGFTLEEVQQFKSVLDAEDKTLLDKSNQYLSSAGVVWKAAQDIVVKDLVYTTNTDETLNKAHQSLQQTLQARQEKYAEELAKQIANDNLCKSFADAIEPFSAWIVTQKDTVSSAQGSLETQLQFVVERINHVESEGKPLQQINQISKNIEAAGITYNRHTSLSYRDVEVQWQQYQVFMQAKSKMLEEEIQTAKLRGMTEEQLKEINDIFLQYDQDGDKQINKKELKACLYSLGEEKTNTEIDQIVNTHGTSGQISEPSFKEFMIQVFGDNESQESVLAGFKLINKGADVATHDKLQKVMVEYDVNYFQKTAPKSGDGYDYNAWTTAMFSR